MEVENWGCNHLEKSAEKYEKYFLEKHKHGKMPTTVYSRNEYMYPVMGLGQNMIHYDSIEGKFSVKEIRKIIYRHSFYEKRDYYYIDETGWHYIDYPRYMYIDIDDPQKIMDIYDCLSYINNNGKICYSRISQIYSIVESHCNKTYVVIDKYMFELDDIRELSRWLMEFDKCNVENLFEKFSVEYMNNRISLYEDYVKYWIDKYFSNRQNKIDVEQDNSEEE